MIRNIRLNTNVSGASSTNHAAATSNIINIDEHNARENKPSDTPCCIRDSFSAVNHRGEQINCPIFC